MALTWWKTPGKPKVGIFTISKDCALLGCKHGTEYKWSHFFQPLGDTRRLHWLILDCL